ncbi:MAG: DUF115 domain-containing protein, partial [Helicobacteraceae bacterium]|nr:DUF115 domain-containing protein [Helicobacteraceae bacterium]
MNFDPFRQQQRALDRFAANEKFFARTDLARYLNKPNERLKLNVTQSGFSVKEGDNFALDVFDSARELAFNPLANPLYKAIVIQDCSKASINQSAVTSSGINEILSLPETDADFVADQAYFDETAPLPPIVFYGALAGMHIAILDENERLANGAIIYEADPEWFVISCYFLDYARFLNPAKGNLLVVGGKMRAELARSFFALDRFSRGLVRLELALSDRAENIDATQQIAIAHKECLRGWGTSEDELVGIQNAISRRGAPRLSKPKKINFAIAVVGAGASLETLFDFLREHQARLVIFSAGTALKPLLSTGIKPDFQIEIERMDHLGAILRNAPIGDIPLIAADLIDQDALNAAKEFFLFARDSSAASAFSEKRLAFSSPIVGNAALALALEFSNEIYLCGIDAGFRRGKKIHVAQSFYDDKADSSAEQTPTRGAFSGDIWTNSLLSHSRASLEAAIASKPDANVFNMSDGAFIAGANPLLAADAKIENKGEKQEAIETIRRGFERDERTSVIDIIEELSAAKIALIATLSGFKPRNKRELFSAAKASLNASIEIEQTLRFGAPFFRGSFWHLTNALIKSLLRVNRSDVSSLYKEGTLIIAAV